MDSAYYDLLSRYDWAMRARDIKAVRRLSVLIERHRNPSAAIDLAKLRAINRVYAAEMHDWIIP